MISTHVKALTFALPAACTVVALAGLSATASGEELNQITIQGSQTTTIGHEAHDLRPIEQSTTTVDVSYEPVALTTNSGVALLREAVTEAAYTACRANDRASPPDMTCIRDAINEAQPQIARAVAQARHGLNG